MTKVYVIMYKKKLARLRKSIFQITIIEAIDQMWQEHNWGGRGEEVWVVKEKSEMINKYANSSFCDCNAVAQNFGEQHHSFRI